MNALTISLESVIDLTEEQFFQLCRKNSDLRFERNAQGDITVMAPVGSETSARNSDLNADLVFWNRRTANSISTRFSPIKSQLGDYWDDSIN